MPHRRLLPGLPRQADPRLGSAVPMRPGATSRARFGGNKTALSYPGGHPITISRLLAEAAAGDIAAGAAAAGAVAADGGRLSQLMGYGAEAGGGPAASLMPQLGQGVSRLPDVAYQPEAATAISLIQTPTACPANLTLTGGIWVTLLQYVVSADRKMIISDVWLRFSNPYFALVVQADLFINDQLVGATVRLQQDAEDYTGIRAAAIGAATVELRAISDTPPTGWATFMEAGIEGWDVTDTWPRNERGIF